ncbi:hypothetical protein, partial [Streptococcus equi]|uniref:hypothetical protein n=1 Tax=Streptococcus equi TaxID=1336 RepID=UPI001BDE9D6E
YMEVILPLLDIDRAEKVWNDIILSTMHYIQYLHQTILRSTEGICLLKIECNEGADIKEKLH